MHEDIVTVVVAVLAGGVLAQWLGWRLRVPAIVFLLAGGLVAARTLLHVDWDLAVLLASVLVVTGPTVIGPIVRSIGLHGKVASILEAEGTLIDPLGAMLTVLVFEALFSTHASNGPIVLQVTETLAIGLAAGLLAAAVLIELLARSLVPDRLHNVATLALVIASFAAANNLRPESGLVAVTAMGVALASQRRVPVHHVLEFNETLRILFISALFVLLGARIEPETLRSLEWRNVAFLAALVLVVRPVGVLLSTIGSPLRTNERVFLAATAPRGIVAAAIASVFSLQLADIGVENSQVLVAATFTVIAGTVVVSGLGSRMLARRLRLVEDDRTTIVVLGANQVARTFAAALDHHGADVRLVDLDRQQIGAARMDGLYAHRGSVFADTTWDAAGINQAACFVAITGSDELNVLAARQAAAYIGRRNVFQLAPRRPEHAHRRALPSGTFARPLFAEGATYDDLERRLDDGGHIASTRLTSKFGPDDCDRVHPDAVRLFLVDAKGRIDITDAATTRQPRAGETVVALTTKLSTVTLAETSSIRVYFK